MNSRTDSCIVEYNGDGSKTVTTIQTYVPPTKAQQASAWLALGGMALVAVSPLIWSAAYSDAAKKRAERKAASKAQKKN